jgi:hypothetical protein
MNAAVSASTFPAKEAANFVLSSRRKPSTGGRVGGTGGRVGDQPLDRPSDIGCESGDINHRGPLCIGARFGHHAAATGMADQHDRSVLCRNRALGKGNVIGKPCGRVLHDRDILALGFQIGIDSLPTGTIHETAMHQHGIGDAAGSGDSRCAGEGSGQGDCGGRENFRGRVINSVCVSRHCFSGYLNAAARMTEAPTLPLDGQLCYSIYAASLAIQRAYKPMLDELGVTYTQYLVLSALWEVDGLTIDAIGERSGLEPSTITVAVKRI